MHVDALIATHAGTWDRLHQLTRKRRLDVAEAEELLDLYRQCGAHLAAVTAQYPDPQVVQTLSSLLLRARGKLHGTAEPFWMEVAHFFGRSIPAALWRIRTTTVITALACFGLAAIHALLLLADPTARDAMLIDPEMAKYVNNDFEDYYSSGPAAAFASHVFLNNAKVAAVCIALGVTGIGAVFVGVQNFMMLGEVAALMTVHGKFTFFLGLITPHGLLELWIIFVAMAAGLHLFWSWAAAGRIPRTVRFAREGRALGTVAIGCAIGLALSGAVEGFVTGSLLPTPVRIGIGALAWALFLGYTYLGRRAVAAGETGDDIVSHRGAESIYSA